MKRIVLILLIFLASCTMAKGIFETVTLETSDQMHISADFYKTDSDKGVILLHMLNRNKADWKDFATFLQVNRYNVIAIDSRGHGDSDGSWQEFTEKDFNKMLLDVDAARIFLQEKGITKIGIVGASIGANTALNYAVSNSSISAIILMSPGLDYRGVKTEASMIKYARSVFIIVSKDDAQSINASKKLYDLAKGKKQIQIYDTAGHGTRMFSADPDLKELMKNWLDQQLK